MEEVVAKAKMKKVNIDIMMFSPSIYFVEIQNSKPLSS